MQNSQFPSLSARLPEAAHHHLLPPATPLLKRSPARGQKAIKTRWKSEIQGTPFPGVAAVIKLKGHALKKRNQTVPKEVYDLIKTLTAKTKNINLSSLKLIKVI